MTTPGYAPQPGPAYQSGPAYQPGPAYGPPVGAPQHGYGIPQQGYGPPPGYGAQPLGQQQYGHAQPSAPARRGRGKLIGGIVAGVIAIFVVLGLVFGSSGSQVQSSLTKALKDRPGITSVTDVSCPKDIDTDRGSTATCLATINGQRANLTLVFDKDDHFVVTDAVPVG